MIGFGLCFDLDIIYRFGFLLYVISLLISDYILFFCFQCHKILRNQRISHAWGFSWCSTRTWLFSLCWLIPRIHYERLLLFFSWISTQSNGQGLQSSSGQNVLILVSSTHMRADFLGIRLVLSYYLYVGSYPGLVMNVIYHLFQTSTSLNGQGEQINLEQKVLTLVFST